MKSKLLTAVLALCFAFGLTACGGGDGGGTTDSGGDGGTAAHRHALSFVGEHAATCKEEGNSAYYICKGCGKWFWDGSGKNEIEDKDSVIRPAGHQMRYIERKDPTCDSDGHSGYYACIGCGNWYHDKNGNNLIEDKSTVTIAAGHRIRYVGEKDSTCTAEGNIAHYACIGCGELYSDAAGNEVIEDKTSVVIPKKPHQMTHIDAKESSCSEEGNIEYYSCGSCEKLYKDADGSVEIPRKDSIVTKKAHKYEDKICVVCGAHEPTEGVIYNETSNGCSVYGIETEGETEIYIADEYNGKKVISVEDNAFENYTSLKNIYLPDTVNFIGGSAFKNCVNLESIEIPRDVTNISGFAFENCGKLESVTLPAGLLMIRDSAFKGCTVLTDIEIPDTVIYMGNRVFEGCENLAGMDIPDSVVNLGEYAFSGCVNLQEITIGSGISVIDTGTFFGCTALATVTISAEVDTIKNYAFQNCNALTTIIFKGNSDKWKAVSKLHKWDDGTGDYTVRCTDKNLSKNESADE